MSKIRDEASKTSQSISGKNRFINGSMSVWQRGTPVAAPLNTFFFGADRFFFQADVAITATLQDNYNQSSMIPVGQRVAMKLSTAAATSAAFMGQRVEGVNCNDFVGKKITFSAWVYSDTAMPAMLCNVVCPNTQDNYGATTIIATTNFNVPAATWTKVVFTFTGTAACQLGTSVQLRNLILNGSSAFYTTGWQLELGEVPTQFEYQTYEQVIDACQRYFIKPAGIGKYRAGSTGYSTESFSLPTRMRTNPTVSASSVMSGGANRIRIADAPTYSTVFTVFATMNEYGVTRTEPSVDGNYIAFDEITLNAEIL